METSYIHVNDMFSQEDANRVLEAIEHVWGLSSAEVQLSNRKAIVTFDERMASTTDFEQAVKESGYEVTK